VRASIRAGLLAGAVAVVLLGCAPRKMVRLEGGRQGTLVLLEASRQAREGLLTLAASGEATFTQKGKMQSGDFQMWYESPDRMRIELSFLFFKVGSAVIAGDSGEVYFPMKRQSYYGKVDNEELKRNLGGVSLSDLFSVLLGKLPLPADSVLGWEEEGGTVAFEFATRKRAWLDLENHLVVRYEQRDSLGKLETRGKAEDFKRVKDFWFPSLLWVERPREGGKMEIRWREVHVNEPFPESRFELKIPAGVERIPVK